MPVLHPVLKKIIFTQEQIDSKAKELGSLITQYYFTKKDSDPIIILGLLKGCVPFMANLMKYIDFPVKTEYMVVASYGMNSVSSGSPQILLDINQNIVNSNVLIVEDIIDSGTTLEFIIKHLKVRGAKEVKIVSLLDKKTKRLRAITADWVGFDCPDGFIVGFGLDYAQRFRNLPYIAEVDIEKFDNYDWKQDIENYCK